MAATPIEDPERCLASALRILQYRWNSEAELRRKLTAKDFTEQVVEETIVRLRDDGWLDDARFAGAFVRTRQLKKIGPRRLARELAAVGVDGDIARAAIAEHSDQEKERDALLALCRKRMAMLIRRKGEQYAASAEGRNKIGGYLLNQGYDGALVREVVKEVLLSFRAAGTPEG